MAMKKKAVKAAYVDQTLDWEVTDVSRYPGMLKGGGDYLLITLINSRTGEIFQDSGFYYRCKIHGLYQGSRCLECVGLKALELHEETRPRKSRTR